MTLLTQEDILVYCRKDITRFSKQTDHEIYNWICENFAPKDYEMFRRCATIIFEESHGIK